MREDFKAWNFLSRVRNTANFPRWGCRFRRFHLKPLRDRSPALGPTARLARVRTMARLAPSSPRGAEADSIFCSEFTRLRDPCGPADGRPKRSARRRADGSRQTWHSANASASATPFPNARGRIFSASCGRGETGKHKGLKIPRLRPCRFESGRPHQEQSGTNSDLSERFCVRESSLPVTREACKGPVARLVEQGAGTPRATTGQARDATTRDGSRTDEAGACKCFAPPDARPISTLRARPASANPRRRPGPAEPLSPDSPFPTVEPVEAVEIHGYQRTFQRYGRRGDDTIEVVTMGPAHASRQDGDVRVHRRQQPALSLQKPRQSAGLRSHFRPLADPHLLPNLKKADRRKINRSGILQSGSCARSQLPFGKQAPDPRVSVEKKGVRKSAFPRRQLVLGHGFEKIGNIFDKAAYHPEHETAGLDRYQLDCRLAVASDNHVFSGFGGRDKLRELRFGVVDVYWRGGCLPACAILVSSSNLRKPQH